jgi:hypothetical protein
MRVTVSLLVFSASKRDSMHPPAYKRNLAALLLNIRRLLKVERETVAIRIANKNKEEGHMKLHTYLNYGGNCEEAFRFYEENLGEGSRC